MHVYVCMHGACMHNFMYVYIHCINKIVKISNLLVSTVTRNSGNCNLIGHDIITIVFLHCLIDVQRSRMTILIESL